VPLNVGGGSRSPLELGGSGSPAAGFGGGNATPAGSGVPFGRPQGPPNFSTGNGYCERMEADVMARIQRIQSKSSTGICTAAKDMEQALNVGEPFLSQCPSADPSGQMRRWMQQTRQTVAEIKRGICEEPERTETYACSSPTGRCAGPSNSQSLGSGRPSVPQPPSPPRPVTPEPRGDGTFR